MARSTRLVIMIKNILCIYGVGNASYCLLHVTCYCGSYSFEARAKTVAPKVLMLESAEISETIKARHD